MTLASTCFCRCRHQCQNSSFSVLTTPQRAKLFACYSHPNTGYMAAVEQPKQEGYPVRDQDLAHGWPTRYVHINIYGKSHFNVEEVWGRYGLRPLRQPGAAPP